MMAISLRENDWMTRLSDHLIQREKILLHYLSNILTQKKRSAAAVSLAEFAAKLCQCVCVFVCVCVSILQLSPKVETYGTHFGRLLTPASLICSDTPLRWCCPDLSESL